MWTKNTKVKFFCCEKTEREMEYRCDDVTSLVMLLLSTCHDNRNAIEYTITISCVCVRAQKFVSNWPPRWMHLLNEKSICLCRDTQMYVHII